jgi:hypothetical protein
MGGRPRYGYPAMTGPAEGFGPADRYRFRDDDGAQARSDSGVLWHRGYRFRPLTSKEIERRSGGPAWRPSESGGRPATPVPPPQPEETYGYRSEGWFGRYFGVPDR